MNRRAVRFGAAILTAAVAIPGGGFGGAVGPVQAATPLTVGTIDSEDGEYYGTGQAFAFVPPDDSVMAFGSAGAVTIYLEGGGRAFQIRLVAMQGQTLEVGAYENAGDDAALGPVVELREGSRACSAASGRFDILEAPVYADGQATAFAADFEIRCDSPKTLYGKVRINSMAPIKAVKASTGEDFLPFGDLPIYTTSAPIVATYTNVGSEPVSITGFTKSGAYPQSFGAAIQCSGPIDPGASCAVDLTARPTVAGNQAATITVHSDAFRFGRDTLLHAVGFYPDATNKTPATAITIGSLPFAHAGRLDGTESGGGLIACEGANGALWYKLTRTTRTRVTLGAEATEGGVYALQVFQGTATGPLVACGLSEPTTFTAEPNVTYWIKLQRKYPGGLGLALEATIGPADTTMDATGVGLSLTTFYPYKDSYRDTVAIRGNRLETADVYISIYNAAGTKVRGFTAAAAKGSYSIAWNGRTSSGVLLPAGKYKVVQRLTDTWGNRKYFTAYTTLSNKRLYTYTFTKTFDAGTFSAYGTSGTGSLSRSSTSYAGGLRVSTGSNGQVGVSYQALVPTATVYKSVKFTVLGRSNLVAGAYAQTGLQDWTMCTSQDVTCVDTWGPTPTTYGWAGHTVTATRHVSAGRYVRGYVHLYTYGASKWLDMQDVRLTVVYGILK